MLGQVVNDSSDTGFVDQEAIDPNIEVPEQAYQV